MQADLHEFMSNSSEDGSLLDQSLLYQDRQRCGKATTHLSTELTFSDDELALFAKRKEEGYDIESDLRYNLWLSLQGEQQAPAVSLPPAQSLISKIVGMNPPEKKNPQFMPKSCARVVTSEQCRLKINERERKKAEALKQKEERKMERQRKKELKLKELEEKRKKKQRSKFN